jgi:hypothetical protein
VFLIQCCVILVTLLSICTGVLNANYLQPFLDFSHQEYFAKVARITIFTGVLFALTVSKC